MLLHATSPSLDWTGVATIINQHPSSADGRPVLFLNGKPVGPAQADWTGYEILKATPAELEALRRGDYHFDLMAAQS